MSQESQMSATDAVNMPHPKLEPQKKTSSSLLNKLSWLALIVIVTLLAWAGQRYIVHLQNTITEENQHLAASLSSAERKLAQQDQKLETLQQQINLFQSQNQMRAAWFLSKAEYLTKLASFILVFQNDVITARKILTEADLQLQSLNDPQIWSVRKAIAADMAAMTAINPVDLPGIVSRLDVISQEVEQLPRIPHLMINPEALKPPKKQNLSFADNLKAFGLAVSENLKGLFEIQYDAPLTPPLLPPDQYLQIVNNIQFQLTMAQWAVLHQQPDIYQQSLKRANSWIARYYSGSDNAVKNILTSIQELQQIKIKPSVPDLSRSLDAIQSALGKA